MLAEWLGSAFAGGEALGAAWRAAGPGTKLFFVAVILVTTYLWAVILREWDRRGAERRVRDAYLDGHRAGFEAGYQAALREKG